MNISNRLSLRTRNTLPPTFTAINKAPSQPPQPTPLSAKDRTDDLGSQIVSKLSLLDPSLKAAIVTSHTNQEFYAHILDGDKKVRYSSMGHRSLEVALKGLLELVTEDAVMQDTTEDGMEESEEENGDENDCRDREMDVD
ncbi:unnamed protein product [Aureobasidium uvarum]|uniref:Uncharacterized protein n=1 Tax=Aureobasidium uvarum TaxID=2773716 RepID=A0A9N8PVA3_9PEZI|nr:unnamed protein product [Aureobasidium uvarum]